MLGRELLPIRRLCWLCLVVILTTLQTNAESLEPLAPIEPSTPAEEELGKLLFFDTRLSGDSTISCATCHDPKHAFTDGLELSAGYPGTLYFRNTPTIINAAQSPYFYWDGRMSGDDLPSLVRDHISEAHFMQADGRLVIERMRQVPAYEEKFQAVYGGEPSYGKILNAVAAFVRSVRSVDVPIDAYLSGDKSALSESAERGLHLFTGKANCVRCHHGPMLTDGKFHNVGVAPNAEIFANPERHITFRRFFRTIGVGDYATIRFDLGCACVTKNDEQMAHFRTPSLREVSNTAPYMHNGTIPTLEKVVAFYNVGGGETAGRGKDELLKPLGLSAAEQADLVELLRSFSGTPIECAPPALPKYELRKLGAN